MELQNANDNAANVEDTDTQAVDTSTETVDVAKLLARNAELEDANPKLFARAKSAEGFVKVDGKWVKAPKPEEAVRATEELKAKTGELDEATLDFFELKGYSDPDQVEVFRSIMRKTGMSHREVIKDDYALSRVKAIQDAKEVKDATPSSTKRSGNQTNDLALALAKFEQSGYKDLPEDFSLRSAVINAVEAKKGTNAPSWHR